MTGWIMWALTSFFRNLGVVAEGMETIAQPIDLVDAPDAKQFEMGSGQIELRGVSALCDFVRRIRLAFEGDEPLDVEEKEVVLDGDTSEYLAEETFETTSGGAMRITWSWVSLQSTPRCCSSSQKRRAPPASGCSSIPIHSPRPRTSLI